MYWYIYCIRKSTICRKGFVSVQLGIKIRVYHQECIKKTSQVDCMTYIQDYISCTLKIDLFSQFVDYHQICHIILEQARFCGIIKTDEPRTLDFSGVRGFLATNVCIVQRSAA